jgi:hypothetical protein
MQQPYLVVAPMNRTRRGPICRIEKDELIVDYDYEHENGTVTWSRLIFRSVLAIEYRQATCCHSDDIISATEIRRIEKSAWLSDVLKLWHESVGWQEWQEKLGGARRFKHYTVFFDDAGCLNVVAAEAIKSDLAEAP